MLWQLWNLDASLLRMCRSLFNQVPLRCPVSDEVLNILREVQLGECDEQQGVLSISIIIASWLLLVNYEGQCSLLCSMMLSLLAQWKHNCSNGRVAYQYPPIASFILKHIISLGNSIQHLCTSEFWYTKLVSPIPRGKQVMQHWITGENIICQFGMWGASFLTVPLFCE